MSRYLKNKDGRVFIWTPQLSTKVGLVEISEQEAKRIVDSEPDRLQAKRDKLLAIQSKENPFDRDPNAPIEEMTLDQIRAKASDEFMMLIPKTATLEEAIAMYKGAVADKEASKTVVAKPEPRKKDSPK